MCNNYRVDERLDPKPIPEQGFGWKVFSSEGYSCIRHMAYIKDEEGWINWCDTLSGGEGDGFCFFLNKADAHTWCVNRETVMPIEYQGGLQEREDFLMPGDLRLALCKRFRIVEETP